jgi:TRAP-type C4-dicarboxylate transport system substrate-binding protein
VVSTTTWESIPKELRSKLVDAAVKTGESLQKESLESDDKAIDIMKQNGLSVNPVSTAALGEWEMIAQSGIKKIAGKSFKVETYDLVVKYLAEYRAAKKQ